MSLSIANKNILLIGLENSGGEYLINQTTQLLNNNHNKEGYLYKLYSLFPIQFYFLINIGFTTSRLYPQLLTLPLSILSANSFNSSSIDENNKNNNLKPDINIFISKHAQTISKMDGFILFYHANIPSSFHILSKLLRSLISLKKSDRFPLIICELSGMFKVGNTTVANDRSVDLKDSCKLASRYCFDLKFLCFTNESDDYVPSKIFMAPNLLSEQPFKKHFNSQCYSTDCIKIKDKFEMLMDCIMQEIYSAESIKRVVRQKRKEERDKFRKLTHGNADENGLISNFFIGKTLFLLLVVISLSLLIFKLFAGKPDSNSFKEFRENPVTLLFKRDQGEMIIDKSSFFKELNSCKTFMIDWYCSNIASNEIIEDTVFTDSAFDAVYNKLFRRPNLLRWMDSFCNSDLDINL